MVRIALAFTLVALLLSACSSPQDPMPSSSAIAPDLHSYANADEVRVTHVDLNLDIDFDQKSIHGVATLDLQRVDPAAAEVILDTRQLTIERVETGAGDDFTETEFDLGPEKSFMGAPLAIPLPTQADRVRVTYRTAPEAGGLQWLTPEQTAGKQRPFLFSQSQAIYARTWIPLQDSPGVRVTYSATVRTPADLLAVMSAEQDLNAERDGEYAFKMDQPIPAYLIALAVGDLEFREVGVRTGVFAEPSVVASAAKEFEDMELMIDAVEGLYGPYRWGRYDVLVLPPSFPFGGMENPRLTFATPTLLAGDKSLVSVIAHELAHSWSGNLVTNATWRDFWLNEGFTVYVEGRIQEEVYSPARAAMEASLEVAGLREELAAFDERDQILHIDLEGRDPDEGFSSVPYIKGMLLLRTIEEAVGRKAFDKFLLSYFDHFAFESITTEDFRAYLLEKLPEVEGKVNLDQWLEEPGLPADAAVPESDALTKVDAARDSWLAGEIAAAALPTDDWTVQEWLHLLSTLPETVGAEKMAELDQAYSLTESGNAEIAHRWLLESVKRGYKPADTRLEEFLVEVGRRKFLKPLYEELAKTPEGKKRGLEIYEKARSGYHPIAYQTVDEILSYKP